MYSLFFCVSYVFSQPAADVDSTMSTVMFNKGSICANIPNVFTPNRDGFDDEWCLKSSGADKCTLWLWVGSTRIIWGTEYVTGENGTTCLWSNGIGDGGTTYPNGTYYYTITLENITTGGERTFQGSVTIFGSTRIEEEEPVE